MKSAIAQEGSDEQVPKSRLFMPSADPFSARLTHAFCHVFCLLGFIGLLVWNAYLAYELATDLRMNDFGRFYYTAVAFLQGQEMYGPRPAEVVQPSELRTGQQLGNLNPPHFHLFVLPLAFLPPVLALGMWGVFSGSCLYYSLSVIKYESELRVSPSRYWVVAVGLLSFTGTQMMLVTGQLSWLLFLPITLAWAAARRGRWSSAGRYLGFAMSVKLFLLIFLLYFVLQRQWRATVSAGMTLLICFTAGVLIFGIEAHRSWLATLAAVNWTLGDTNVSILGFLTRILSANAAFASFIDAPYLIRPLWLLVVGFVGVLTFVASVCCRLEVATIDRGFALLLLAALLISPLGWTYYLWFPLGPFTALFCSWWGEKQRKAIVPLSSIQRWRDWLLLAATPGLVWPFLGTRLLQPHPWATVVFGSIYFWSTFLLWSALIADWWVRGEMIVGDDVAKKTATL